VRLLPNGQGPVHVFRRGGRVEYRDARGRVLKIDPR
jgi:hypothetical protein